MNIPGVMIVYGGTVTASLLTFQLQDVISAIQAARIVLINKKEDPNDMIETILSVDGS